MIIFEEISPIHRLIVKWYVLIKQEVYFIRLNRASKDKRWINNFLSKGCIKKMNLNTTLHTFDGLDYDRAFDNIGDFYQSVKENGIIRGCIKLYRDDNMALAFKKSLSEDLARFYYLNQVLSQIQNEYSDRNIMFVPAHGIGIFYITNNCEIYDYSKLYKWARHNKRDCFDTRRVKFPIWAVTLSYISAGKRKLKVFLQFLGFSLWTLLKLIKRCFAKHSLHPKSYYEHAIMVISQPRQFANEIQKVDFLIDNETIKKKDTIFLSCIKLKKENKNYMKNNELNYLDDIDKFISRKEVAKILPIYFLLLVSFFKENSLILSTGLKAIYFYLRWESLTKNIGIKRLISHSDFGSQSIARNILLEQKGCKTYYYIDAANFDCFFAKENWGLKYRYSGYGFIYYNYFISWNAIITKYFKNLQCSIKNYVNLGCLWAEHANLIKEGKIASNLKHDLFGWGYQKEMKLISVFDSGLHDDFLTTYEDGIKFLDGILRLLSDLPNVFVILKEKKPRVHHQKLSGRFMDILELYDKLEKHPRCHCIKNAWESASEIMAFSDLTISFPFTSTTLEALAARKKAIWYDATNKFSDTFYHSVPGLVCHSYNELLKRTKVLLNISGDEYDFYLDTHIKEKVEGYLDGKALTRFRNILTGNENCIAAPRIDYSDLVKEKE